MTDRWEKEAAKIVFEFESRIQAGEFDANPEAYTASDTLKHLIAAALSDAYEAGRREEREACNQIVRAAWGENVSIEAMTAAIRSREAAE